MSTMTDGTYNGWKNRETWAFNLHWSNDQGMYLTTLAAGRDFLAEHAEDEDDQNSDYQVGEFVVKWWRTELDTYEDATGERLPAQMAIFDREVGSWWRIDYAEV